MISEHHKKSDNESFDRSALLEQFIVVGSPLFVSKPAVVLVGITGIAFKKQTGIAGENADKMAADVEHCKNAWEREVIPFLSEYWR